MIRDYVPGDETSLRRMHAEAGIDYRFPDLESPLYFVRKVRVVDGRITGALMLKGCAEAQLLLAPAAPGDKMAAMRELEASVLSEARERGLDEIHAAVPAIGFDKRLRQLGWLKDRPLWRLWTRSTRCDQQ